MKHILHIIFAVALLFTVHGYTLRQEETNEIFTRSNTDNEDILEGDEIQTALIEAINNLFDKAKLFKDEGLIKELAKEFSKECSQKLTKEGFNDAVNKLYSFAKTFREKAYKDILTKFEMNEVLNDPDLLEEVMRKPDVYGITYGSSGQEVLDEIERVYKETAEALRDIQKQFQELLDKAKAGDLNPTDSLGKPVEHAAGVSSEATEPVNDAVQNVIQTDEL